MHVNGHTGTIRSSVTANMNLIGERLFWYRYRVQCDRVFPENDFCLLHDGRAQLNKIWIEI